jgi:hypothetical protein
MMIALTPKRGKQLKCRIESLSGYSILCRFEKELENILSKSLKKLIRVSGYRIKILYVRIHFFTIYGESNVS